MEDTCNFCGLSKPIAELMKDSQRAKGYRNKCYPCLRKEKKEYYQRVKLVGKQGFNYELLAKRTNWAGRKLKEHDDKYRKNFLDGLRSGPCVDCGNTFPPCAMDFDHLPGTVKLFGIMNRWRSRPWDDMLTEIAKCEIVCACCHRVRTEERRSKL